jgi:hypothetical protein
VETLIGDLAAAGADVGPPSQFEAEPLAPNGVSMCVDGQTVQVYIYPSPAARMAATSAIDPDDPTNIGTSIVEWDGEPKFWQRDRVVLLYLGRDEATTELLTSVLGEPFARGESRPQLLPGTC